MSTPQPTYTISNLQHTTQYYVWIQAEDGIGNVSAPYQLPPATTVTADGTDPVVSGFDANQSATGYAFSPSGTVSDNKAGPLKVYLIMADTEMTAAQLALVKTSVQDSAKNENVQYTAGASLDVATLNLSATQYWNGTANQAISDAVSGSLVAHLLVLDANNNAGSAATAAKTVADRTAPQFSGSVALEGVGSDSIKVSWDAGFTDGRGLDSGIVYYSTADPGSDLAAWKLAASSETVAASSLAAAGDKTVGGSLAAGTYYAYLSVEDAAGNTLDVQPSPASVTLAAPVTDNDVWQFVITEKADGVGTQNKFPGLIQINQVRWNQTTTLTASMVTQMIATSSGDASGLLNASVQMSWRDTVGNQYNPAGYAVNDTLFTFTTPKVAGNPIWTIEYHRPIYRPGFKILRNGVSVYTESGSVATNAEDPSPYSWEYVTRKPTLDPASITSSDPVITQAQMNSMFDKSYNWGTPYLAIVTPNTITMTFAGPAKIAGIRFYSLGEERKESHSLFQTVELRGDPAGANVLMANATIRSAIGNDVGNWIYDRRSPDLPSQYKNYYYDLVVTGAAAETYYQTVSVTIAGMGADNNMAIIEMEIDGVIDTLPPQFSGSVALEGVGADSLKVTWSTGFTDGRGLNSGLIYYSTSDPSAAANLTAWKTAATSANVAAADLGAAGNQTVPSLAAGTYYAYLSVADAAGNTLDVRPSPASVDLGNQTAPPLPAVGGNFTSPTAPPGMGTPNDKGVYTVNTEIEKSISLTGYTPICTYVFVIKSGGTMSSYSLGAQSFVGIERRSGSGQVGQLMMYQDFHRYVPSGQTQQTQASLFTPSVTTNNAITDTYIGDSTRYRAIIFRQDFSGANKICRIDVVNSTGLVTSKETSQAVKTEGIYHNIIVYSAPTTMLLYGYVRRLGQYISDADALAYGRYLAYQADNA